MPERTPVECPACGHHRIARRTQPPREYGALHPREARWTCGLCGYVWTQPEPPRREVLWAVP